MFYKINIDEGNKKKFADAIDTLVAYSTEDVHCNVCERHWKKIIKNIKPTVVFTNDFYADFMYSTVGVLISSRAKEVLGREKISGYSLIEVKTSSPNETSLEFQKLLRDSGRKVKAMPNNPPMYYLLSITKEVPLHKNIIFEVESCSACGYTRASRPKGSDMLPISDLVLYIDKSQWDGSEIFKTQYFGRTICSERFYQVYQENKLTGLLFEEFLYT